MHHSYCRLLQPSPSMILLSLGLTQTSLTPTFGLAVF